MKSADRDCSKFAAATAACVALGASFGPIVPAARAQTVITNGGVTVHNPNGTTTRVTNNGVTTTHGNGTTMTVRTTTTRTVTRRGGASAGGSITINENDRTTTLHSRGGSVTINGNGNHVTITGTCARLAVTGNHNRITTGRVGAIDVPGNNNRVYWLSGASGGRSTPNVTTMGSGNNVSRR